MEKIPECCKVSSLKEYLKKLDCDPYFYLENNRIQISLYNPEIDKIPKEFDFRLVGDYRS